MKINATFIFKQGTHLLEWPEVCKRWRGEEVLCVLFFSRQLLCVTKRWKQERLESVPHHVSGLHPHALRVSSAALPRTFQGPPTVLGQAAFDKLLCCSFANVYLHQSWILD